MRATERPIWEQDERNPPQGCVRKSPCQDAVHGRPGEAWRGSGLDWGRP